MHDRAGRHKTDTGLYIDWMRRDNRQVFMLDEQTDERRREHGSNLTRPETASECWTSTSLADGSIYRKSRLAVLDYTDWSGKEYGTSITYGWITRPPCLYMYVHIRGPFKRAAHSLNAWPETMVGLFLINLFIWRNQDKSSSKGEEKVHDLKYFKVVSSFD